MAHYDYRCPKCGVFELEQSIKEKPLTKCPKCGSDVKRLISASGVVFKGSGFHVNDYKKDGLHETRPMGTAPAKKPDTKAPKSS
jgi:putative FmdB family regulatory protein